MLILASGSAIRAEMLRNAGVSFAVDPATVDEGEIRDAMLSQGSEAIDIAKALAVAKAQQIAAKYPDDLVLGADQVLVCEGRLFEKPTSTSDAADQLRVLRGKQHELISAVALFEENKLVWQTAERVQLRMRDFSDSFLKKYVTSQGDDLLTTVGSYKLEGAGAQLFTRVEGDYFSVLGLPLLEVLAILRTKNIGVT